MKAFLRFALLFAAALGGIAWGASTLLNRRALTWAERDMAARARLALSGARPALSEADSTGTRRVVDALVRDERLMGAAVCTRDGLTVAASLAFPVDYGCDQLPKDSLAPGKSGWDLAATRPTGSVHVSVLSVEEEGNGDRVLVMVHDMSFVDRRADTTRRFTFFAFALVGLVGAVAARAVARFTWRTWTAELRRLLAAPFSMDEATPTARRFQPLLSDVRDLVSTLTAEESRGGAAWTPERLRQVLHRNLRGEGIVVVANREPYIHDRGEDGSIRVLHPASGLVTALEPVMRACSGTWIAHGSGTADRETVDGRDRVRVPPGEEAYSLRRIWLTKEEEKGYYYGFANEGLWPLCHIAHTRPEFRVQDWEHYKRVNRRFAEAVAQEADVPDPIVLVQDYHFALLPEVPARAPARARRSSPSGTSPGPTPSGSASARGSARLLEGMLGSSIIGFHTQAHCNNFVEAVDRFLEAAHRPRAPVRGAGRAGDPGPRLPHLDRVAQPLGGRDPAGRRSAGRRSARSWGSRRGVVLGVGVDRLDYTKGIEERLLAVERSSSAIRRGWDGSPSSRCGARAGRSSRRYRALNERVEALAERINARFARPGWRPIVADAPPPRAARDLPALPRRRPLLRVEPSRRHEPGGEGVRREP